MKKGLGILRALGARASAMRSGQCASIRMPRMRTLGTGTLGAQMAHAHALTLGQISPRPHRRGPSQEVPPGVGVIRTTITEESRTDLLVQREGLRPARWHEPARNTDWRRDASAACTADSICGASGTFSRIRHPLMTASHDAGRHRPLRRVDTTSHSVCRSHIESLG